jgi:hypothetical protein
MDRQDAESKFYNVLSGNEKIYDFEKWVYDSDEELIDQYFGQGFYFALASLNYKNKFIMNELEKLLFSKVPFGRFEQMKINHLLNGVINDEGLILELPDAIYDLYCDGYTFLRDLGMIFAACDSNEEFQIYKFDVKTSAYLKREAHRILSYLDSGKIVITGVYEYDDNRTEEEMTELFDFEKKKEKPKEGFIYTIVNKVWRTIR